MPSVPDLNGAHDLPPQTPEGEISPSSSPTGAESNRFLLSGKSASLFSPFSRFHSAPSNDTPSFFFFPMGDLLKIESLFF